jgi:hypothetical protein
MRVLLDTQAFIYAIDENQHHKLPARARRALLGRETTRELSLTVRRPPCDERRE